MIPELSQELHKEISRLSALGDSLAREQKFDDAIAEYQRAYELLPEPRDVWNAAIWLLAAIGDAYFLSRRYERAREEFTRAILCCPEGAGNPFLHLRLGESLFECDKKREAADELMLAYMSAGDDIFNLEDKKYFQYLKTVASL